MWIAPVSGHKYHEVKNCGAARHAVKFDRVCLEFAKNKGLGACKVCCKKFA